MTTSTDINGRHHDPLCRGHYQRITDPLHCTDCDLILRTRRDTLRGALVELEDAGERHGWTTSPDGYQLMHTSDATDTIRRLLQELPK